MSLTFGFYNSINGDRVYDAIQMGQIFDGIITDGVYATYLKAMVVKASDNPSEVIVQPGRAWFNHTWTYIDADYPVEAPLPEVILDRVDTLVLDINAEYSNRENKIIWVQGTPASVNPEAPALINTTTHHQYPLCNVYRKAGTTMIYAADITNRVGTSATPFVTGVLTGINIDDLLSQWDDEFHTWEAATKTSFEAWFETIKGIIDEEAATHLQAEIDELKDMLPAGSHIDISTNETTLFNRNVTVSDGVHSKTVQFNAVGGATVESFPYIGIISVTSTDGERIAQETINIPYFGRYSVVLAFWSATVNLVGDESLAALPVTVKDSNGDVISVVTLNASGSGTFTATKPDTYKFIYTYGGQTMETTLQVTQETTYEVEIHGGFNYQAWLTAGRVSKTFSSLDEILADEETLRQLFLVHDAVDYICNTFSNGSAADVTKIFNTDLAAKWINLSDYALDHFYAVADIKSIMDTADKYGYGEWVITDDTTTPPTWGAKGNVPVMTSASAPYGTVICHTSSTVSGYEPYKIFDGNDSTVGAFSKVANGYMGYKFTNPIMPKKCVISTNTVGVTWIVQGSNDNSTWEDISEPFTLSTSGEKVSIDLTANKFYLYLIVKATNLGSGDSNYGFRTVQFYGRELKVSVPTMTSSTAPYGEASANSVLDNNHPAWKAFNGTYSNSDDCWHSADNSAINGWLGYAFINSIKPKKVIFRNRNNTTNYIWAPYTFKIQGSNDGSTWTDLTETLTTQSTATSGVSAYDIDTNNTYSQLRLIVLSVWNNGSSPETRDVAISTLQFYGLDYSEKEFEEGTTKKWLYDHGVELEEMQDYTVWSGAVYRHEDSSIYLEQTTASNAAFVGANLDLTSYNLARAKIGNIYYSPGTNAIRVINSMSSATTIATKEIANADMPNNVALNISSVNGTHPVGLLANYSSKATLTELWLE